MSSSTKVPDTGAAPRTTVLARRPLLSYRTIDLMTAALIGVVFGLVFWAWDALYSGPAGWLEGLAGPMGALIYGPWLLAGVVAGLLIRRPGAALFAETVAAVISAYLGNKWGWTVVLSGLLQGAGAELAFAAFRYRRFTVVVAALAGALAAAFEVIGYEWHNWYSAEFGYDWEFRIWYLVCFAVSGIVVAGVGGWLLVRALARTGAIRALPPGQEEAERSAS